MGWQEAASRPNQVEGSKLKVEVRIRTLQNHKGCGTRLPYHDLSELGELGTGTFPLSEKIIAAARSSHNAMENAPSGTCEEIGF